MKGLLGIKLGMTQVFDDKGVVTPVTVIQAGPCYVTQVKSTDNDGYEAIQVGFGEAKPARLSKGEQGHLGLARPKKGRPRRDSQTNLPAVRYLREFRTKNASHYQVGQVLTVAQFEVGERIDVTGKTKGRGFAGNVKRHGFRGGPRTHGQSDRQRAPGSVGATTGIGNVLKGTRMAGRMGNEQQKAQNLEVMRIDPERNLIAVKGAIPGAKGGLVVLRDAAKQ